MFKSLKKGATRLLKKAVKLLANFVPMNPDEEEEQEIMPTEYASRPTAASGPTSKGIFKNKGPSINPGDAPPDMDSLVAKANAQYANVPPKLSQQELLQALSPKYRDLHKRFDHWLKTTGDGYDGHTIPQDLQAYKKQLDGMKPVIEKTENQRAAENERYKRSFNVNPEVYRQRRAAQEAAQRAAEKPSPIRDMRRGTTQPQFNNVSPRPALQPAAAPAAPTMQPPRAQAAPKRGMAAPTPGR